MLRATADFGRSPTRSFACCTTVSTPRWPPRMDNATGRARFGGDEGIVGEVERIFSYWLPNPNLAGVFAR
jgi:hypothetical protein